MTVTFLSAGYSLSVTANSVCSSAGGGSGAAGGARGRGERDRSRGGDAELLLHVGDELDDLQNGHLGNCFEDFVFAGSHVGSPKSVSIDGSDARGLFLVANGGDGADELRLRLGQRADQLLDRAPSSSPSSWDNACSRVGRLATFSRSLPGSTCPPMDTRVGTSLSLRLREVLHHARGGAWIVLRESEHERSLQLRSDRLERRADEGLACQRILDDTHVHALPARLGTQLGHLRHRDAAVLGSDDGLGFRRNRAHFLSPALSCLRG